MEKEFGQIQSGSGLRSPWPSTHVFEAREYNPKACIRTGQAFSRISETFPRASECPPTRLKASSFDFGALVGISNVSRWQRNQGWIGESNGEVKLRGQGDRPGVLGWEEKRFSYLREEGRRQLWTWTIFRSEASSSTRSLGLGGSTQGGEEAILREEKRG